MCRKMLSFDPYLVSSNKLLSKYDARVCEDDKEIPFGEAKNPVCMGVHCKLSCSPTVPVAI